MMTAKDIRKKKFEKIKFGYNPEEVDAFMAEIENDLRVMEQELADANNKVQLLADKVREYKADEEDLKNALIGAQRQAREVLAEANAKAASIEEEAKAQAATLHAAALEQQEEQLRHTAEQLEQENQALVTAQRQVANFKKTLFEMYKEHLELISQLPDAVSEDADEVAASDAVDDVVEVAENETVETSEVEVLPTAADSWDTATDAWGDSPAAEEKATEPKVDPFRTSEFSREAVRAEQESRFSDLQFGSRRDDRRRDDRRKKRS